MKKHELFVLMLLAFTLTAFAGIDYAYKIKAEIQTAGPQSLGDITWQQGVTPLIRVEPYSGGRSITADTNTAVRMLIAPSATNSTWAGVTNYTTISNFFLLQWPTIGTNTVNSGGTNEPWWYTIYFEENGHRYWTGNGDLYIEETTSTATDGLSWIEFTTPSVAWGDITGDIGLATSVPPYVGLLVSNTVPAVLADLSNDVTALETYTSRVVTLESYTSRVASALDSNTAVSMFVDIGGDTMTGPLTSTAFYGSSGWSVTGTPLYAESDPSWSAVSNAILTTVEANTTNVLARIDSNVAVALLSKYLPLTGGTVSGEVNFLSGNIIQERNNTIVSAIRSDVGGSNNAFFGGGTMDTSLFEGGLSNSVAIAGGQFNKGNIYNSIVGAGGAIGSFWSPLSSISYGSAWGDTAVVLHDRAHVFSDAAPGWGSPGPKTFSVRAGNGIYLVSTTGVFIVDQTTNAFVVLSATGGVQVGQASFRMHTSGDIEQDATNTATLGALTVSQVIYTNGTTQTTAFISADYATGTPVYAESDPIWTAASNLYLTTGTAASVYATGTPLYVETYTGTIASLDGYATGTPLYVETYTGTIGSLTGYATGTPLYAESDPIWAAASNLYLTTGTAASVYATGTPLYVETGTGTIGSLAGYATGTPLYVEADPVFLSAMTSGVGTWTISPSDADNSGAIIWEANISGIHTMRWTSAGLTLDGTAYDSGLATGTPLYVEAWTSVSNSIQQQITSNDTDIAAIAAYTSRVVAVEAYTSRVVSVEAYTARVVAVEGYTNRAASALSSSVWLSARSTDTNRVRLAETNIYARLDSNVWKSVRATDTNTVYVNTTNIYGRLASSTWVSVRSGDTNLIHVNATNIYGRLGSNTWAAHPSTTNYTPLDGWKAASNDINDRINAIAIVSTNYWDEVFVVDTEALSTNSFSGQGAYTGVVASSIAYTGSVDCSAGPTYYVEITNFYPLTYGTSTITIGEHTLTPSADGPAYMYRSFTQAVSELVVSMSGAAAAQPLISSVRVIELTQGVAHVASDLHVGGSLYLENGLAGYATGTPLYAYTESDPIWTAASNSIQEQISSNVVHAGTNVTVQYTTTGTVVSVSPGGATITVTNDWDASTNYVASDDGTNYLWKAAGAFTELDRIAGVGVTNNAAGIVAVGLVATTAQTVANAATVSVASVTLDFDGSSNDFRNAHTWSVAGSNLAAVADGKVDGLGVDVTNRWSAGYTTPAWDGGALTNLPAAAGDTSYAPTNYHAITYLHVPDLGTATITRATGPRVKMDLTNSAQTIEFAADWLATNGTGTIYIELVNTNTLTFLPAYISATALVARVTEWQVIAVKPAGNTNVNLLPLQ